MARESLKACQAGINKAKLALTGKGWTQEELAEKVQTTRQPVANFFAGKGVDRKNFVKICELLELDWQEIAGQPKSSDLVSSPDSVSTDIDALVQEVRKKIKPIIKERCGTIRVLDMEQPIGLNDIYTDVNILEKITGRRRLKITELLQRFDPESDNFDRCGLGKIEKRIPGLEAVERHPKLMVLGKPGAGKTTFLKYLAIQCICGEFQANRIPIFITLKQVAEANYIQELREYISKILDICGVSNNQLAELVNQGRFLFLLDGLDEVMEKDSEKIINQIFAFTENYFYTKQLEQKISEFIEWLLKNLELIIERNPKNFPEKYQEWLDNNFSQTFKIVANVQSFFTNYNNIKSESLQKFRRNLEQLCFDDYLELLRCKFPEEYFTNQFVITCRIAAREEKFEKFTEVEVADFDEQQIKIFVNKWYQGKEPKLAELFIQQLTTNQPIQELANNPLLLTLLCLVFKVTGEFPSNRSELYKEGISILLKKWDGERLIKRDQIYKNLYPQRKEDLLSQVALTTFERGDYFFKQKEVERHITDYIRNLLDASTDPETLQLDSEAVLKSIEAQHGLLVERAKGIYSFSHLTFQEYFTARKIVASSNPYVLDDESLQSLVKKITDKRWWEVFLLVVGMLPKADNLLLLMKQEADTLAAYDHKLQRFLLRFVKSKSLSANTHCKPAAIRAFFFALGLHYVYDLGIDRYLNLAYSLNLAHNFAQDYFSCRSDNRIDFECQFDIDRERDFINSTWHFSDEQKKLLDQYYNANKLLVDCLNSDCYVSREMRQEIEDTLLLPVS